jgi:hypothetical protein
MNCNGISYGVQYHGARYVLNPRCVPCGDVMTANRTSVVAAKLAERGSLSLIDILKEEGRQRTLPIVCANLTTGLSVCMWVSANVTLSHC